MSPVIFREARAEDELALLGMMRKLAEQEPGAIVFHESAAKKALRGLLANPNFGKCWVVCEANQPVGYVVLTLGYSLEYQGRESFIDELYIEPGYRRRGLGRQAVEFAEEQARSMGVNVVHLEVDHGNDVALQLYRRAGYEDHDRFLMTKWISPRNS